MVTKLLKEGHIKNVDAPNAAGWTALHLAAVSSVLTASYSYGVHSRETEITP